MIEGNKIRVTNPIDIPQEVHNKKVEIEIMIEEMIEGNKIRVTNPIHIPQEIHNTEAPVQLTV